MTDPVFLLQRHGGKSVAKVSSDLAQALGAVIGLQGKSQQNFEACMGWLNDHAAGLEKNRNPKLAALAPHFLYYLKNLEERSIDPLGIWSAEGAIVKDRDVTWLGRYLPEFLSHITTGILEGDAVVAPLDQDGPEQLSEIYQRLQRRANGQSSKMLRDLAPFTVAGLPSEANLNVLFPIFEKTLDVPGDVCEFGCFRGVTSVKMAFVIKALGKKKTVYAFDTFDGFQIDDPGGGALGVGAFSDHFDAFGELSKWGRVLPIVPVKGDATKTCAQITAPLSFIWFDLDMGTLMDPVLKQIWPHISKETIIGVDDVGRPETPTVLSWIEGVVKNGALKELGRHENEFIRFYQRAH